MKRSLTKQFTLRRLVLDVVQHCNLRCTYCYPGDVAHRNSMPIDVIQSLLEVAKEQSLWEVTFTGGEATLHPNFSELLEAIERLEVTSTQLITNATRLTEERIAQIAKSSVTRVCVSLDSADSDVHELERGRNTHGNVLKALENFAWYGKQVTVISVAHAGSVSGLVDVSRFLAEKGLASQHHISGLCYSGFAKEQFDRLRLLPKDYVQLQTQITEEFESLQDRGLFVTFNSYWPATGEYPACQGRVRTLSQFVEQEKGHYAIVRPNGDFRVDTAAWGRERILNRVIGNVRQTSAREIFQAAQDQLLTGPNLQLPRELEARYKFQYGTTVDPMDANALLSGEGSDRLVPTPPLHESPILGLPLDPAWGESFARERDSNPSRFREVDAEGGVTLVFDRERVHVTTLSTNEFEKLGRRAKIEVLRFDSL